MQRSTPDREQWHLIPPNLENQSNPRRRDVFVFFALAFLLAGVFVIGEGSDLIHASPPTKVSFKLDKNPPPVNLTKLENGYASIIDPALPAVVNISSTRMVKHENNFPGFFGDPFFRQFFGDQFNGQSTKPEVEREYSLGSGVIVSSDGYILTNNHVVSGASDIEVFTQDKKKFRAKVVGTDSRSDVAVLKIGATQLPVLTLGDSSRLKVGDLVFAIGDPFGVGETATMGIVSATGRGLGGSIERYEDFIQTDAAINPGNSGGALLDIHGDLIGINTAILTSGSGGSQGVGFAIPIDMARNDMRQIVDHGRVIRGHLGIRIQSVDADMAKAFGLQQGGGALVADVTPDSPAAKAGIRRGDIVLELNGQPVSGPDDLSVRISQMAPGTVTHLRIFRDGKALEITATLEEVSEKQEASENSESSGKPMRGISVQNLTPSVAHELGVSSGTTGVVITAVDDGTSAAEAGLTRGDVILEVNRKPVRTVTEYNRSLAELKGQSVLLLIERGETTNFVVVQAD